jgi:hypothetical protein
MALTTYYVLLYTPPNAASDVLGVFKTMEDAETTKMKWHNGEMNDNKIPLEHMVIVEKTEDLPN